MQLHMVFGPIVHTYIILKIGKIGHWHWGHDDENAIEIFFPFSTFSFTVQLYNSFAEFQAWNKALLLVKTLNPFDDFFIVHFSILTKGKEIRPQDCKRALSSMVQWDSWQQHMVFVEACCSCVQPKNRWNKTKPNKKKQLREK